MRGIVLLRRGPLDGLQVDYEDHTRIPMCWFGAAMEDHHKRICQPYDPTNILKVYYKREGTQYVNLSGDIIVVTFAYEGIFKHAPSVNCR